MPALERTSARPDRGLVRPVEAGFLHGVDGDKVNVAEAACDQLNQLRACLGLSLTERTSVSYVTRLPVTS